MNKQELQELKRIQNYFGEHCKTPFEHWAFSFLDGIIKSIDGGVQEYDKRLRDAYEWWHYLIPSMENNRLMKKYYPNEPTGSPRFFMDTDKLRIYMLENGIEQDAAPAKAVEATGVQQRMTYGTIQEELNWLRTIFNEAGEYGAGNVVLGRIKSYSKT
jgi:hypothetical protein